MWDFMEGWHWFASGLHARRRAGGGRGVPDWTLYASHPRK
jgi:hypothetical protein